MLHEWLLGAGKLVFFWRRGWGHGRGLAARVPCSKNLFTISV